MIKLTNEIFSRRVVPSNMPCVLWALMQIGSQPKPPVLALKLIEMRRKLEQHGEDFNSAIKQSLEALADKDADAKPIIVDGEYQMSDHAQMEHQQFYEGLLKVEFTMKSSISQADLMGLREISEQTIEFLGELVVFDKTEEAK